jgi:methyltransferase (TIGR00027 family)
MTPSPSSTAQRVAERRAAHQLLDAPVVLNDPLALRIVGATRADERARLSAKEHGRLARTLRAFLAARSRVAEDEVARLASTQAGQYVILGAGLDTFAYRNPFAGRIRVFEVDQPFMQAWKRERLSEAGIAPASDVVFVPVDFEVASPFDVLPTVGWDRSTVSVVAWLGVTMYLERDTVLRMLKELGRQARGSVVIFDYAIAPTLLGPIERLVFDEFAKRVAASGEPWISSFEPRELREHLLAVGFSEVEDLGPTELNDRYFANRTDGMRVGTLAHIIKATV